jgi:ATP-dependent exoDNAse (exonuclease V) beta subunit
VCPGQHAFETEGYSVVWWDPGPTGGLLLGARPSFGVRRAELVVKDVARHVVADGRSRYDRWCLSRADAQQSGSRPSVVAKTVREWTADLTQVVPPPVDPRAVAVIDLTEGASSDAERPSGPTFGVLVHAVLAQVPLDAGQDALDDIARLEARVLGLSPEEARAAASIVTRVLSHDIASRARAAGRRGGCRREAPVTYTLPDGTLVEGVVDLAFEDEGRWCVVDYKTDRELGTTGEEHYRRQVAIYAAAIQRCTGVPADAFLVRL